MLLTGTHVRTLDDKKRLALPKRIREQLAEAKQLFVTRGPDQCLWIFAKEGLEKLADQLDKAPATDGEARIFRRLFFAQMETVDVDGSGRILVPDRLVTAGSLVKDVVLLGVRDHLELWDSERWQKYLGDNGARFDAVAEAAFQKNV